MHKWTAIALLAGALPGFAWGPEGHRLIARIAEAQLVPAAHTRVIEILGPGATMASVSSWADEVRRSRPDSGPWHYIDIPINQKHLDMARDCPHGDCVIRKIEDFEAALRDPRTPPVQRREALMFIIHFVGDMHQPLHCSDNKDKGGNDVHIIYSKRNMNLHSLWDGGLLGNIGKEDELFPALSKESARRAKKWSKGSVEDWAEQIHRSSVKIVYGKLPKAGNGALLEITPAYEMKADPLVREEIEKGGARLAYVLNQTLQ
jgi:hypothetical protein